MKIVQLKGGYFNGITYGIMPEDQLPDEILLHYYVNPRAELAGITILGITKKGDDDVTRVLSYKKEDSIGSVVIYTLAEEVDPYLVRKNEDTGELEYRPGALPVEDAGEMD